MEQVGAQVGYVCAQPFMRLTACLSVSKSQAMGGWEEPTALHTN